MKEDTGKGVKVTKEPKSKKAEAERAAANQKVPGIVLENANLVAESCIEKAVVTARFDKRMEDLQESMKQTNTPRVSVPTREGGFTFELEQKDKVKITKF